MPLATSDGHQIQAAAHEGLTADPLKEPKSIADERT
jgi:hypothetical protein